MLAQEIKRSNGDIQDFNKYANDIIQTLGGISNLQLAPKGIIEHIYPLKGNEKAIGHNLLVDDKRRKEAHMAIETQTLTLAGPFELIQGGVAVIGRNPIFIQRQTTEEFWGFASALIFLDDLLAVTDLDQLAQNGYSFQIKRVHPDTSEVQVFVQSKQAPSSASATESITVPNGHWIIVISRPYNTQNTIISANIISIILAGLFSLLLNRILREPERLRIQVAQKTQKLKALAFHDELTGLVNRRCLQEQLAQEIRHLQHQENHMAIIYLDLDDFKRINDTMGHEAGDHLLQKVSQRIRDSVRSNDIVARLGGDEFAVALLNLESPSDARLIIESIMLSVRQPLKLQKRTVVVSTTAGVTFAPNDSSDVNELFRNADLALFDSKRAGKDQYSFFNPEMQKVATDNLLLEEQLRAAVRRNEFSLVYQPIISLHNSQPHSFEALIRWQHPKKGEQAPASFIGIAETTGLIIPMGYWVIEEACQFILKQKNQNNILPVAINISARQLNDERFADNVANILSRASVSPNLIELELTESMFMEDLALALELIDKMKAIGVRISIDDFGTGYSSLSQLKKFPIDTLKLDRSFVDDLSNSANDKKMVDAITNMVHKLGIKIIAEGIETEEQLHLLKQMGCDYGQGFLFSRPLKESHALSHFDQAIHHSA
jgi:diguanylate cyclase (GGDEF)-like protein